MRIELSQCSIRELIPSDADAMARYGNNRKVWLQLRDRFPHPYRRQDAEAFLHRVAQQSPTTVWCIDVAGEAAGTIGIVPGTDVERIGAEIGYWLGEPFWGRGIMTEVVRAVTLECLERFQLARVFAVPYVTNAASCRVLEKVGYVCEGRLRRSALKDGQLLDQLMYAYVRPGEFAVV